MSWLVTLLLQLEPDRSGIVDLDGYRLDAVVTLLRGYMLQLNSHVTAGCPGHTKRDARMGLVDAGQIDE